MTGAKPARYPTTPRQRHSDEMGTLDPAITISKCSRCVKIFDPSVPRPSASPRRHRHQHSLRVARPRSPDRHRVPEAMAHRGTDVRHRLPDRELACAPIDSPLGQAYLGAMRAAINCALANRQIITHLVRQAFAGSRPRRADAPLRCVAQHLQGESTQIDGRTKRLFVHRKGATRALGPGHPDLPPAFASIGQPVFIGGTMGTASYVLVGTSDGR